MELKRAKNRNNFFGLFVRFVILYSKIISHGITHKHFRNFYSLKYVEKRIETNFIIKYTVIKV